MTIKMPHVVKLGNDKEAAAFIAGAAFKAIPPTPAAAQDDKAGKAVVNMRFDAPLLARIDAAAAGNQPHGMAARRGLQGA
jgi:hypothetical protein